MKAELTLVLVMWFTANHVLQNLDLQVSFFSLGSQQKFSAFLHIFMW